MVKEKSPSEEPELPTTENSPNGSTTKPAKMSWREHIATEISLDHADIPIILCCLVSGLCDSSAYNAWSCFVSMQTGNTIFLALGASGQPLSKPFGWLKSLISIAFFICGCATFAQTRLIGPRTRGTLSISFILQALCIVIAAALVQAHVVPEPVGVQTYNDIEFKELIPLAFLAFQSGGQIVTSRLLGFNEVPTTVLTSVYCDLASDPKFFERDNVKRNRRMFAVVFILMGGIVGGWISRSSARMSTSLWIAAAIKFGIAIGWSNWKSKPAIQL